MLTMDIEGRLDSWKKIAVYLQRDERTVQRWHSQRGLPVHRIPGSKQSSVFAYRAEIDAWLTSSTKDSSSRREPDSTGDGASVFYISRVLALWECRSESNLIRIIDMCREAIAENPMDAEAFGVMASAYIWAAYLDVLPGSYVLPRAGRAVDRALEVNPREVHALASRAWLTMCCCHDRKTAESQFGDCLSIQPDNAFALVGIATSLSTRGELNEARRLMAMAWQNEPLSSSMPFVAARLEYYAGEYINVLTEAYLARQSGEDSSGLRSLVGLASAACRGIVCAEADLKLAAAEYPESALVRGVLGYVNATFGHTEHARQLLAQLLHEEKRMRASAAYAISLIHCGLGEREEAFHWLERGSNEWSMWLWALELDNAFAPLREERRFLRLVERQHAVRQSVPRIC